MCNRDLRAVRIRCTEKPIHEANTVSSTTKIVEEVVTFRPVAAFSLVQAAAFSLVWQASTIPPVRRPTSPIPPVRRPASPIPPVRRLGLGRGGRE